MSTMLGVPLSKRSNSVSLSNVSNGFVSSGCDQDTNELALTERMELIESKHDTKLLQRFHRKLTVTESSIFSPLLVKPI